MRYTVNDWSGARAVFRSHSLDNAVQLVIHDGKAARVSSEVLNQQFQPFLDPLPAMLMPFAVQKHLTHIARDAAVIPRRLQIDEQVPRHRNRQFLPAASVLGGGECNPGDGGARLDNACPYLPYHIAKSVRLRSPRTGSSAIPRIPIRINRIASHRKTGCALVDVGSFESR